MKKQSLVCAVIAVALGIMAAIAIWILMQDAGIGAIALAFPGMLWALRGLRIPDRDIVIVVDPANPTQMPYRSTPEQPPICTCPTCNREMLGGPGQ